MKIGDATIELLMLMTTSLFYSSDAFVFTPINHRHTFTIFDVGILYAKNTKKNKKRVGGRGKPKKDGVVEEDVVKIDKMREPSNVRKISHIIDRPEPNNPLHVCTVEVDDVDWWEDPNNDNPFGGKLWPSSIAISNFLVSMGNLEGYDILELGCGVGLVSIVAGEIGARVVASDISFTVLQLCKAGWRDTQNLRHGQLLKQQKDAQNGKKKGELDETIVVKPGSLNTFILDLFSEVPLPISTSSSNKKVVIAASMMYDPDLAAILARRAFEACARGAWVIIGDDDTGEREGGRQFFISEMDRLESDKGIYFERNWTSSVIKSKALNWSEKQAKVLHLNMPQDVVAVC
mmetsp:Transcript_21717/g.26566  ORF Transcript_21717/g.26566 Transcript_21717/m.26566 type:complete len:347 (+) Transcript_21717:81-1121(+)